MKVAILGAGAISGRYLENLVRFPELSVEFIADLDVEVARAKAEEFGVPGWGTFDELLAGDCELVVNLTTPAAHHPTTLAALEAGKHVWLEKPLATSVADARHLVERAEELGLTLACAPDTVLGEATQHALRLVADGAVGELSSGLVAFSTAGPQGWHPAPEFLFSPGGGPLWDVGPYYLTCLALAFGPAVRVYANGSTAQPTRVIGSGPRAGTEFAVTTPSTVSVLLEYASGAHAQALFSFDSGVRRAELALTGAGGTVLFADPNQFDGTVEVRPTDGREPLQFVTPDAPATRGIGVLEMARAISEGRRPRAGADLAAHVVEIMEAAFASMEAKNAVPIESTFEGVDPLPTSWTPFAGNDHAAVGRQ